MLSHRRFDVAECHRMARAGILTEDDRVELIDGEIVQMSAIGSRHTACVRLLTRALGDPAAHPAIAQDSTRARRRGSARKAIQ